jgi:hypothetical protein
MHGSPWNTFDLSAFLLNVVSQRGIKSASVVMLSDVTKKRNREA